MPKSKLFTEEIKDFRHSKKKLVPVLVVFGLIGLFLPIIPGVALLLVGFVLIFPKEGENLIRKIRELIRL